MSIHTTNRKLAGLRSVCYWPMQYSWTDYWDNWASAGSGKSQTVQQTLATDFARFASAGINCVRVNLYNGSTRFGGVTGSPTQWARANSTMLANLATLISTADRYGLKVCLYLYDFANAYLPQEGAPWTNNTQYLSDILTPYANDPRIAFVALRNEVDLVPGNDFTKYTGTSTTTVAPSTQSISVANKNYVYAGQTVWIDDGGNQEAVTVAASPAPTNDGTTITFTATFTKSHSGTYNVYLAYPTQAAAMAQIDTWMQAMIDAVRTIAPNLLLTVSCSGNGSLAPSKSQYLDAGDTVNFQRMCRKIGPNSGHAADFYEVHVYGSAQSIRGTLAQHIDASVAAGPLPVYIGEYGFSSNPDTTTTNLTLTHGVGTPNQAVMEAAQAHYYHVFHAACIGLGLNPGQPWMVNDITGAGRTDSASVAAGWNSPEGISTTSGNNYSQLGSIEYYRGIWRPDGSAKPVATPLLDRYKNSAPQNVFNASFDSDDGNGWPLKWQNFYPTGFDQTNWTVSLDTGRTGTGKSLLISSVANSADPNFLPAVRVCLPISWAIASTHTVSGWMKTASATGTNLLSVWALDLFGTHLTLPDASFKKSTPNQTGTNAWAQFTLTFALPASTSCIEVRCESRNNSGSVWFDDITIS